MQEDPFKFGKFIQCSIARELETHLENTQSISDYSAYEELLFDFALQVQAFQQSFLTTGHLVPDGLSHPLCQ